jgi:hypothetical protein
MDGQNPPPPLENFRDSLNNLSMNESNIKSYLFYLDRWTNDIRQNPKNPVILNKYVDTAFAFLRDLQKYPNLRQMTYDYDNIPITTSYILNKIKETNKFIIDNLYTTDIKNQPKFIEMNINLKNGNFRGGIMNRTNKNRTNKNRTNKNRTNKNRTNKNRTNKNRTNKKMKKTYKRRRLNRKRNN